MNKEEAINILSQVCANVSTNLQQHQAMQQAIQKLSSLVEPVETKKEKKK